ncbi:MAG TPA: GlsB/YeaQ/YmgE family stress response membrane protein [Gaiellaceae bacterium]
MHWVWLIIVGAVVGALGRLLHPGRDPMGWLLTILIGIASLVIAGLIFSNGAVEFIVGIIVAVILVWLVGRFMSGRGAAARA